MRSMVRLESLFYAALIQVRVQKLIGAELHFRCNEGVPTGAWPTCSPQTTVASEAPRVDVEQKRWIVW